jgi:hypothetical protein
MFASAQRLLTQISEKKSVSFAEKKNQVFEITHVNDIPDEEFERIWFSEDEYDEIKAASKATVSMMKAGIEFRPEQETSRGLEFWTYEGAWAKLQNKRDGVYSVLYEQERQWVEWEQDEDAIAAAYIEHSEKCARVAAAKGLQDEMEAIQIVVEQLVDEERAKAQTVIGRRTCITRAAVTA